MVGSGGKVTFVNWGERRKGEGREGGGQCETALITLGSYQIGRLNGIDCKIIMKQEFHSVLESGKRRGNWRRGEKKRKGGKKNRKRRIQAR
jgi:hypothetical protein